MPLLMAFMKEGGAPCEMLLDTESVSRGPSKPLVSVGQREAKLVSLWPHQVCPTHQVFGSAFRCLRHVFTLTSW